MVTALLYVMPHKMRMQNKMKKKIELNSLMTDCGIYVQLYIANCTDSETQAGS